MQPGKTSVTLLFNSPTQYLVPVFQRGYVWTLEKQVAPLWADLEDRALKLLERTAQAEQVGSQSLRPLQKHFLGSLVLTPVNSNAFGRVPAYEVIDGQQRTTTLHILLLAFRHASQRIEGSQVALMLEGLVKNPGPFAVASDCHKVWPTQAGRSEMESLDGADGVAAVVKQYPARKGRQRVERPLMVQAYLYLYHAFLAYLRGVELSDPVSEDSDQIFSDALIHSIRHTNEIVEIQPGLPLQASRAEAFYMTLQELVQIMTLKLESEDDPQVIFETLNARGEPLLASDLIRNFVFLEAARRDLPVNELYASYWQAFDEQHDNNQVVTANRYWREKERQGRINYPRIDLFFYHYTVLRCRHETKVSQVFQGFKEWWQTEQRNLATELDRIVKASVYFRELISPEGADAVAEFARLIKALDVGIVAPVYIGLRERFGRESHELKQALGDLASFVTRRAVCGLTTKNYNRLFLKLLSEIAESSTPALALRKYLLKLRGHSQEWPSDEQFEHAWRTRPVYEVLRPGKVCAVLRALEYASRTSRQETNFVASLAALTVEHVMPQSWEQGGHYPLPDSAPPFKTAREAAVQTLGNLTLLTQPLNSSASNGPFLDYENDGNKVAGKRTRFLESVLLLNAYFQNPSISIWDDQAIGARGLHLFKQAAQIWSRPIDVPNADAAEVDTVAATSK